MEQHFEYKWIHDRNICLKDEIGEGIQQQLPDDIRCQLFSQFIYSDFLESFKEIFDLEKHREYKTDPIDPSKKMVTYITRYSWNDDQYSGFMIQLMLALEPRREESGNVIMLENEEWHEIFFFVKGSFAIGFELDNQQHYVLKFDNSFTEKDDKKQANSLT